MILFLVNNDKNLGSGNLKRCQLIKNELKKKNYKSFFYSQKKINLIYLKKIIILNKIKFVIIDNYTVQCVHRRFLKKIGCKIIQLNYFVDNDNYIDFFFNYLKPLRKNLKVINDINKTILSPYKKYRLVKKKMILIYFSIIKPRLLVEIIKNLMTNKLEYQILLITRNNFPSSLKNKYKNKLIIKKNVKNLNYYLNKSEILISGGGLTTLEATRYNVKNIVIFSNNFQKRNSHYLLKNDLIAYRFASLKFNIKNFIKKIKILKTTKKKFKTVSKNSLENGFNSLWNFVIREKVNQKFN